MNFSFGSISSTGIISSIGLICVFAGMMFAFLAVRMTRKYGTLKSAKENREYMVCDAPEEEVSYSMPGGGNIMSAAEKKQIEIQKKLGSLSKSRDAREIDIKEELSKAKPANGDAFDYDEYGNEIPGFGKGTGLMNAPVTPPFKKPESNGGGKGNDGAVPGLEHTGCLKGNGGGYSATEENSNGGSNAHTGVLGQGGNGSKSEALPVDNLDLSGTESSGGNNSHHMKNNAGKNTEILDTLFEEITDKQSAGGSF